MVVQWWFSAALVLGVGALTHIAENRVPLEQVNRKRDIIFDIVFISISALLVAGMTVFLLDEFVINWLNTNLQFDEKVLSLPLLARITIALIIGDFGYYIAHRSMHTNYLWPTHRFHHSIREIYWFSGLRTSALNSLIIRIPYLVSLCAFGISQGDMAIVAILLTIVNFWVHTYANLSLGPLNYIFISPAFHRIHHSMVQRAEDKNFGNILSCWDYLFGTSIEVEESLVTSEKGYDIERNEVVRQLIGV